MFTVAPDGSPTALFVAGTEKLPQGVWLDAVDTWHFTGKNGHEYIPSTQNPYTKGGKTGGMQEIPNEEVRQDLKQRCLQEVLLFVSDGLTGMADAVKRQFPKADHQSCWVHLSRSVARLLREKDRKEILNALKAVYTQDDAALAEKELDVFIEKYEKKYPKIRRIFSNRTSLFSFYKYLKSIRRSIYTSNLIENNNKGLKHKPKGKEQFPNESSLERFVCCFYSEYNRKHSGRVHQGFRQAEAELVEMFSQRYPATEGAASQDAA